MSVAGAEAALATIREWAEKEHARGLHAPEGQSAQALGVQDDQMPLMGL